MCLINRLAQVALVGLLTPVFVASTDNWFAAGAIAAGLVFLADQVHAHYGRKLAKRMAYPNSVEWTVEVNQVPVGTITDSVYASICNTAIRDIRLYARQVLNVLRMMLNAFDYCYLAIPLGLFWAAVGLAVFSPEWLSEGLAALQRATPEDVRRAGAIFAQFVALLMMAAIAIHWMFGMARFGFVNQFELAIDTAIRKHCGCAADGAVSLGRQTDDGWVAPSAKLNKPLKL